MISARSIRSRWGVALSVGCAVVLAGGLIISGMARSARAIHRENLSHETATAARSVEQALDLATSDLEAITGFFLSQSELTPEDFSRFADSLNLVRNPSSVAIVQRVTPDELPQIEADLRRRYDVEPYGVIGGQTQPLIERDEYYIATHEYGLPDGSQIVGFDLLSEPSRASLIIQMEATRTTRFGDVVPLVGLETSGFPIFVPIVDESGEVLGAAVAAAELETLITDAVPLSIAARADFRLESISDLRLVEPPGPDQATAVLVRGERLWQLTGTDRQPLPMRPYLLAGIPVLFLAAGMTIFTGQTVANRNARSELRRIAAEHQASLEHQTMLEKFEILASNATDMVTRSTPRGRCLYVSPSSERLTGYPADDLPGRNLFEFVHPEDRRMIMGAHARLLDGSQDTTQLEYRIRHHDGEYRWFDSISRLVVADDGVEIQTSSRDITEKVEQRGQLRKARRDAEAAGQAKAQFVANISHEIRTPLNAISGMTDLALASDLTGTQREYLHVVKSSTRALLTIVNDVLDLSKAAAGQMTLTEEGFLPRDVFSDVVRSLEREAEKRDLQLILECDERLPEGLIGDAGRIRQILVNLIGNALKFTHQGGVTVSVAPRNSGGIVCKVSDTGIGIAPERIDAVFDDFTQADGSTTRDYGGTGLGLGISRRLVEMMGGQMWVTSELDAGSTFTFELPLETWAALRSAEAEHTVVPVITRDVNDADAMATLLAVGGRLARRMNVEDVAGTVRPLIAVVHGPGDPLGVRVCAEARRVLIVDADPQRGNSEHFQQIGASAYIGRPAEAMDVMDLLAAIEQGEMGFFTRHDLREARPIRNVLIADDVATNRLVVEQLLGRRGHDVTSVANGQQAVDAMSVQNYDIVLMDVQMPVMDGLTATGVIRRMEERTDRHTPIIAVTGRAMAGDREAALEAGCDGYMTKPFDPHQLLTTVERLAAADDPDPHLAGSAPLDLVLLDMHTSGDRAMLETLLDTARLEIVEQRLLLDPSDPAKLVEPAHKLKGMLGMIGARPAAAAAAELEQAARSGRTAGLPSLAAYLDDTLMTLAATIDELLGRSEPTLHPAP